jgi:hypothetical protein
VSPPRAGVALWVHGAAAAAYVVATWLTRPHFMGDTVFYAEEIQTRGRAIWEFGHLLWRPLGKLFGRAAAPLLGSFAGGDERAQLTLALAVLGWLFGLMCVVLTVALLGRVCRRAWVVLVVAVAFILSHGFLNFSQTGCSYVPGLAFLLLGLYLLARDDGRSQGAWLTCALAAAAFALSLGFWFLYLWALPAALALPLFLRGFDRRGLRLASQTAALAGALTLLLFAAAMIFGRGYTSLAEARHWITEAGHGATTSGVLRMLFGLARSFVNMGNDGVVFKRFLVKDPLNPVPLAELFRLSLWKLGLFYAALAAVSLNLARTPRGRRLLAFAAATFAPLLAFAALWQGGDIERYLPLYPALFLALAAALDSERSSRAPNAVALLFVVASAAASVNVMGAPAMSRQEERVMSRIRELEPRLKPESTVAVVHQQDELWRANYSFPFNPTFRRYALLSYAVAATGTEETPRWRANFAAHADAVWRRGGDVWVSKRLTAARPLPEWNWVEGGSPVRWEDLRSFFSRLEAADSVGGEDGFLLLARTPRNEETLRAAASAADD